MAVTITGKRVHESFSQREVYMFVQYTLSGTYVTGGFVTPFSGTVTGSPGTNPVVTHTPLAFDWYSPLGYIYYTSIVITNGFPTCTTKIFSAAGTELANTTAIPDASVLAAVVAQRY